MPKKINTEDPGLYRKMLMGFSIVQYVLAFIYFMYTTLQVLPLAVILAIAVVGMLVIHKLWEHKPVRVVVRVVYIALVLAITVIAIISLIQILVQSVPRNYVGWYCILLTGIMQIIFLSLYPMVAFASLKGHAWDIVCLRVLSVMQLLTAIGMGVAGYLFHYDTMGIANDYFNLFYVLCVAATTSLVFLVHPVRLAVFKRFRRKKADETEAAALPSHDEAFEEPETAEEPVIEEDAPPVKPVFRDLGDEAPPPPVKEKRRRKNKAEKETADSSR